MDLRAASPAAPAPIMAMDFENTTVSCEIAVEMSNNQEGKKMDRRLSSCYDKQIVPNEYTLWF